MLMYFSLADITLNQPQSIDQLSNQAQAMAAWFHFHMNDISLLCTLKTTEY